eukprot:13872526-Ditylum_brightwellii.AAC.1
MPSLCERNHDTDDEDTEEIEDVDTDDEDMKEIEDVTASNAKSTRLKQTKMSQRQMRCTSTKWYPLCTRRSSIFLPHSSDSLLQICWQAYSIT